jgi:hypothetical protein
VLPEILGFVALSAAVLAWMRAGRLSRKLEALNQSYWELRYDYTRLRSQVARLDPETEEAAATAEASPSQPQGTVAFVSLSSMKKKN